MSKKIFFVLALNLSILALLLTACGKSTAEKESMDKANIMAISIEQTVQVRMETQLAELTATPASTETSTNTPTTTGTAVPSDCLLANLVSETIVDGTLVQRGFPFTKTWKISNIGTCPWTTGYKFVFVGGDAMGAPTMINLPENVAAGGSIDISLNMVAPASDASYTGYWALQTDSGVNFAPFTVQIVVGDQNAGIFTVTNVTTSLHDLVPVTCPYTYNFDINITTNGAGTVKYTIEDRIIGISKIKYLDFTSAGTVTAEHSITINRDGDYWILVYIEQPNQRYFGPFNFNVNCP